MKAPSRLAASASSPAISACAERAGAASTSRLPSRGLADGLVSVVMSPLRPPASGGANTIQLRRARIAPESHDSVAALWPQRPARSMNPAAQPERPDRPSAGISIAQCAKMSSAPQPARSSSARVGRKAKQAWASSVRPSRASIASSRSCSAWRWSTSEAA